MEIFIFLSREKEEEGQEKEEGERKEDERWKKHNDETAWELYQNIYQYV